MNIKSYIENFAMWADKKNSLIAIREYLSIMGLNLENNIIHVAGTNGKGSVCAYLSNMLTSLGFSVGTFTSPHLIEVNERISFNLSPISDEELERVGEYIKGTLKNYKKEDFHSPSYFEFLFYLAMKYFKDKNPDFIILETGMGGRLDITNAIDSKKLCIITSISLDHKEYLGNSIEKIAFEKAGILKSGTSLVFDDNDKTVKKVISDIAKEKYIPYSYLSDFKKENSELCDKLILNAEYKKDNAMLSMLAIQKLLYDILPDLSIKYNEEILVKSINNTMWHGRMQEIEKGFFIDGAHNEAGISRLIEEINSICMKENKNIRLLISALSDKDIDAMFLSLRKLKIMPQKIYISRVKSHRYLDENKLNIKINEIMDVETQVYKAVSVALDDIKKEKRENELIFAFGSLYLVAEILNIKGDRYD